MKSLSKNFILLAMVSIFLITLTISCGIDNNNNNKIALSLQTNNIFESQETLGSHEITSADFAETLDETKGIYVNFETILNIGGNNINILSCTYTTNDSVVHSRQLMYVGTDGKLHPIAGLMITNPVANVLDNNYDTSSASIRTKIEYVQEVKVLREQIKNITDKSDSKNTPKLKTLDTPPPHYQKMILDTSTDPVEEGFIDLNGDEDGVKETFAYPDDVDPSVNMDYVSSDISTNSLTIDGVNYTIKQLNYEKLNNDHATGELLYKTSNNKFKTLKHNGTPFNLNGRIYKVGDQLLVNGVQGTKIITLKVQNGELIVDTVDDDIPLDGYYKKLHVKETIDGEERIVEKLYFFRGVKMYSVDSDNIKTTTYTNLTHLQNIDGAKVDGMSKTLFTLPNGNAFFIDGDTLMMSNSFDGQYFAFIPTQHIHFEEVKNGNSIIKHSGTTDFQDYSRIDANGSATWHHTIITLQDNDGNVHKYRILNNDFVEPEQQPTCNDNEILDDGECHNLTELGNCTPVTVENGQSVVEEIEKPYNTETNGYDNVNCTDIECNENYIKDDGACHTETEPGNCTPVQVENGQSIIKEVEKPYNTATNGYDNVNCANIVCNEGYHPSDDGTACEENTLQCNDGTHEENGTCVENQDIDGDGTPDHLDTDLTDGPLADKDNDGVINREDNCPNTAQGVDVDENGCEIQETECDTGKELYNNEQCTTKQAVAAFKFLRDKITINDTKLTANGIAKVYVIEEVEIMPVFKIVDDIAYLEKFEFFNNSRVDATIKLDTNNDGDDEQVILKPGRGITLNISANIESNDINDMNPEYTLGNTWEADLGFGYRVIKTGENLNVKLDNGDGTFIMIGGVGTDYAAETIDVIDEDGITVKAKVYTARFTHEGSYVFIDKDGEARKILRPSEQFKTISIDANNGSVYINGKVNSNWEVNTETGEITKSPSDTDNKTTPNSSCSYTTSNNSNYLLFIFLIIITIFTRKKLKE